jgi:hypothetical protein
MRPDLVPSDRRFLPCRACCRAMFGTRDKPRLSSFGAFSRSVAGRASLNSDVSNNLRPSAGRHFAVPERPPHRTCYKPATDACRRVVHRASWTSTNERNSSVWRTFMQSLLSQDLLRSDQALTTTALTGVSQRRGAPARFGHHVSSCSSNAPGQTCLKPCRPICLEAQELR